jgi:hypothetical protein
MRNVIIYVAERKVPTYKDPLPARRGLFYIGVNRIYNPLFDGDLRGARHRTRDFLHS